MPTRRLHTIYISLVQSTSQLYISFMINITTHDLNIAIPRWSNRDGSINLPLLQANSARMKRALVHPPGTLLQLECGRVVVVLDGGWLLDGKIFSKMGDLSYHVVDGL